MYGDGEKMPCSVGVYRYVSVATGNVVLEECEGGIVHQPHFKNTFQAILWLLIPESPDGRS